MPPLCEKEKGLTERRRLVPRVCPSSSKNPGPVVLRGKTHDGEQITPCQATRTPTFEVEDVCSRAGFVRARRNETCPPRARETWIPSVTSRRDDSRSNGRKLTATAREFREFKSKLARPANATSSRLASFPHVFRVFLFLLSSLPI